MTTVLLAVATVRQRTVYRVALAAAGFEVHDIERPEDIANILARAPIEVMVLDVTRAYGGSALLQQLSRDADLPPAVLALTPVNEPAVVLAALDAGAKAFLPVSASAERVVVAVQRMVGWPWLPWAPARTTIGATHHEP